MDIIVAAVKQERANLAPARKTIRRLLRLLGTEKIEDLPGITRSLMEEVLRFKNEQELMQAKHDYLNKALSVAEAEIQAKEEVLKGVYEAEKENLEGLRVIFQANPEAQAKAKLWDEFMGDKEENLVARIGRRLKRFVGEIETALLGYDVHIATLLHRITVKLGKEMDAADTEDDDTDQQTGKATRKAGIRLPGEDPNSPSKPAGGSGSQPPTREKKVDIGMRGAEAQPSPPNPDQPEAAPEKEEVAPGKVEGTPSKDE